MFGVFPGSCGVGPERPSGGNAALASMGLSKHFNSQKIWRRFLINQKIWRHFLINRPLEMAVQSGRKGCFVFPYESCSHRSSSSLGAGRLSLALEVLPVMLSPTGSAG